MQTRVPNLETALLDVARRCIERGPGFSQEMVVLREAMESLGLDREALAEQQRLLTAWNNLFRKGILAWGYDMDNPTQPFFHITEQGREHME
jgi:hypothetical protein